MPLKLNDARLNTLYKNLELQKVADPGLTLDTAKVAELCSALYSVN